VKVWVYRGEIFDFSAVGQEKASDEQSPRPPRRDDQPRPPRRDRDDQPRAPRSAAKRD